MQQPRDRKRPCLHGLQCVKAQIETSAAGDGHAEDYSQALQQHGGTRISRIRSFVEALEVQLVAEERIFLRRVA